MGTTTMRALAALVALIAGASAFAGCSSGDGTVKTGGVVTHRVPQDFPTIQKAVDAAKPGELVLVSPGVYKEAVDVTTKDLTIRGVNRNTVILEGGFKLENGIRVVETEGVQ